jgi:hypothetical protein
MATENQDILKKAEMGLGDLENGGLLPDRVAKKFLVDIVAESELLSLMRTVDMPEPTWKVPKMTIIGRVSHAATEGVAPPEASWTAPVTSEIELTTKEFVAVLPLNDSIIEDNIEKGGLWKTCETLMKKKIAEDVQENFVLGDVLSADPDLAQFDGMLKLITSNVVDAAAENWSVGLAEEGMSAMPERYLNNQEKFLRWFGSATTERKYRKEVSERATGLGDLTLQTKTGSSIMGIKMVNLSNWPLTQGSGDKTTEVLMNPKNFVGGWHRKIKVEWQRDAMARKTYMVWSYRVGCNFEEEQATVEVNNISLP